MRDKFPDIVFQKREEINRKLEYFDDPLFSFDEEEHKYTYDGVEFTSVTTYLKNFKRKFESDYWAERKAIERGISKDEILKEWKGKGDVANVLGTAVHEWIEKFWIGWEESIIPTHYESPGDEVKRRCLKFLEIYEKKLHNFVPLKPELRVFSKKWRISGTIDQPLLFWDEKMKKVLFVIGDWKTNKEFKDDHHPKGRYQKLLRPFIGFYSNSHNEYSLQISLYRLILEEIGIETHSGFLCHIGPQGPARLYPAKDFRDPLKIYLDHNRIFN